MDSAKRSIPAFPRTPPKVSHQSLKHTGPPAIAPSFDFPFSSFQSRVGPPARIFNNLRTLLVGPNASYPLSLQADPHSFVRNRGVHLLPPIRAIATESHSCVIHRTCAIHRTGGRAVGITFRGKADSADQSNQQFSRLRPSAGTGNRPLRLPRLEDGVDGSAGGREDGVEVFLSERQKRFHDGGIELGAAGFAKAARGFLEGQAAPVRA